MPQRKVAISIPADTLARADRLARRRGTSRSALIAELVEEAARRAREEEITAALDACYSDPESRAEQGRLTREVYRGEALEDEQW